MGWDLVIVLTVLLVIICLMFDLIPYVWYMPGMRKWKGVRPGWVNGHPYPSTCYSPSFKYAFYFAFFNRSLWG